MIVIYDKDMNEVEYNDYDDQWFRHVFPLDNFSNVPVPMYGEYFKTAEHAFQYTKFMDTNEKVAYAILNASTPEDARNIAHYFKSERIPNWSEIKYDVMEKVLKTKVEKNEFVKRILLDTKDYIITEQCIDEDTDWGLDNNNQGENHLGKIWMKIRQELIDKNDIYPYVLGFDCDGREIEEYMILKAIWSNDFDLEELPEADPRYYCAIYGEDGNAYAISVYHDYTRKLIMERENIPKNRSVPTIVKPISEMENYEIGIVNEHDYFYYDRNREDLKKALNKYLKKKNNVKKLVP